MKEISKKDFFLLIAPRDICVSYSTSKDESYFTTRSGTLVGVCKWIEDGENVYFIDESKLPPVIGEEEE